MMTNSFLCDIYLFVCSTCDHGLQFIFENTRKPYTQSGVAQESPLHSPDVDRPLIHSNRDCHRKRAVELEEAGHANLSIRSACLRRKCITASLKNATSTI